MTRLIIPQNRIPIISDLHKRDTIDFGYPDDADSTSSESTGSTPTSPVSTRSPSPFVPVREVVMESVCMTEDEIDSLEESPLAALREKERKKIRQSSGVKPKVKAPRKHGPQSLEAAPSSNTPLEMVQCRWDGCTKRLYVDYISVRHWGEHVRTHYSDEQGTIQCKWRGGCGAAVNKSSMWKHVVSHQSKFKVRCPKGCGVSTREDMLPRHTGTCNYTPGQPANGGSDEEEDVEVGEESHGGDYDGDSEDVEEEGSED